MVTIWLIVPGLIPESITIAKLKDNVTIDVDAFGRLTGYTGEEVSGRRPSELATWGKTEDHTVMIESH